MKIYDISQEIFSCVVFPGDPAPKKEIVCRINNGDICNLTAFSMCAHNGTHIDAPFHFVNDGKTVEQIDLSKFIGYAYVAEHTGLVTAEDARAILQKASAQNNECTKKILIKGNSTVSNEAAQVFAEAGIDLIGNESQTVGPENAPVLAHKILLSKEVVLLEGVRLANVAEGVYFLSSAPISLGGGDGAPCRAVLIEM